MTTQASTETARRTTPWIWILSLWLLLELVGAFFASAGTFRIWPTSTSYHDRLAEAFRHGQLYLIERPNPALLTASNPFDEKYRQLWLWDASLHAGKYYLYWGPLPALLLAGAKSLLRVNRLVGDQFIQHFFFSLAALFGALLIERLARQLFEGIPRWLLGLSIAAFALVNPVLFMTSTPSVYHTAIAGGQAFLLGGMVFAFDAVTSRESGGARWPRLLMCGVAFALALACRLSLAPAVAILILLTALFSQSEDPTRRLARFAKDAFTMGAPVCAVLFALGVYNQVRFGSWLQTGLNLQLSTMKYRVEPRYLLSNLYAYTLEPYRLSCRFPHLMASWLSGGAAGLPGWLPAQPGSMQEPVVGWLIAAPITWLFPASLFVAARSMIRRERSALLFCTLCFAAMATVAVAPDLPLFMVTMRYLADATYGLVLLGLLGGFTMIARAGTARARRAWSALVAALAVATLASSLLLGFQGYDEQLMVNNRPLYDALVKRLSMCGGAPVRVGGLPLE